jgi:hypothetical protein
MNKTSQDSRLVVPIPSHRSLLQPRAQPGTSLEAKILKKKKLYTNYREKY